MSDKLDVPSIQPNRLVFEDLYRVLVETSADLIVVTDAFGRVSYANEAARELLGYEPEEMLGADLGDFLASASEAEATSIARRAGSGRPLAARRVLARRSDGSSIELNLSAKPLGDGEGAALIFSDVSAQELYERELSELIHDNELILRSVGDGILRLDPAGLISYANPAAGEILGCSHVELMGADAHALLHRPLGDGSDHAPGDCPLREPLDGEVVHRSEEVFWWPDGTQFAVKYTSAPMHEDGTIVGAVCVFADISDQKEREQELRWELEWQRRITRAVESDRLLAYSQPIVDLASGEAVQEELLVRMRGRSEDIVPPVDFLPTAERLDLIGAIDRWMLAKALELVAEGRTVAVNISARSLTEDRLLDDAWRSLSASDVDPAQLIFEITETAACENSESVRRFAAGIERLGCRLALDDFGTGFGTMTYLKTLPAQFLKIDMDFVQGLADDPGDKRIVRTIVDIARNHGQRTIAEGVENEKTVELLRELGVDFAQGHFFGRPAPLA
jgi:PAS domain S-box-containing protein